MTRLSPDSSEHSGVQVSLWSDCDLEGESAGDAPNRGSPDSCLIPRKPIAESHIIEETKVKRHIHWLLPTLMTISLLWGLLLAIGHHFYYHWLDGQIVGTAARQQWSLR